MVAKIEAQWLDSMAQWQKPEERISEFKDRKIEITQCEKQRENQLKKVTESQEHGTNHTRSNICMIRRKGGKKKAREKRVWLKSTQRNRVENFPNLAKDINLQIRDFERTPNGIHPKKSKARDITIKLLKIKDQENILKAMRENQHLPYIEKIIQMAVNFSSETHKGQKKSRKNFFSSTKR